MPWEASLRLLRGPVFWAALTFLVLGLGRHVAIGTWGVVRSYRLAGDRGVPWRQVLLGSLRWLAPTDRLRNRLLYSLTTWIFHASVILVPIFLAGHIDLWRKGVGLSWPALPNPVATALTVCAIVAAVAIVVQRLVSREPRLLSRFQDFVMPLVVAVPFASGVLVMHPTWNPFAYELTLFVHVLSADFLLVLIPLTKLSHMALLPGTQLVSELAWHFPPDAGRKVGIALGKADEPI